MPNLTAETAPAYREGPSRIHGRGLFAARPLAAHEWILEYTGEKISKAESRRRQAASATVTIFEVNTRFDLDGGVGENPARWVNHSCAANCEARRVRGRIWLRAVRPIAAGDELTLDYGYRLAAFPGHPCRCGAAGCAGFIVAQTDRWRARRWLGRRGCSLVHTRVTTAEAVRA